MVEVGDVTLNIYKLSVPSPEGSSGNVWTSRLLPAIGMGAYHTSLTVGTNQHYTFAAQQGIVQSRKEPTDSSAVFQESLFLGYCRLHRGQVLEIVQIMKATFSETAYHLVHRNCNHFTETFATALLKYEDLMEGKPLLGRLNVYPVYINRLATTGAAFIGHDDDIVPCNVLEEAICAVGAEKKIGWDLTTSKSPKDDLKKSKQGGKKVLTEAQKKALAKIRKT